MLEKIALSREQTEVVDGIRALAVLAVVALHWKNILLGAGGAIAAFTTPGVGGVIVFFTVSGLCITLSKKPAESWGSFYLRRLFRILPACWLMLGGYLVVLKLGWNRAISLQDALTSFSVTPNWFGAANVSGWSGPAAELNPVLWSLQTEIELYLLFPLSLLLFRALSRRQFLFVTFAVTMAAWIGWLLSQSSFTYFPPFPSLCHWWIWNLGLYLCFLPPEERHAGTKTLMLALLGLGIGAGLLLMRNGWRSNAFSFWYFFTGIGSFFFVKWALTTQPQWLRHPVMVFFGKRSYSIYLLHWPVAIVGTLLFGSMALAAGFALATLIVISEISYRFIELPFIRLGKSLTHRIDARRNAPLTAPIMASAK